MEQRKIELLNTIAYGSVHGLITASKGSVLTIKGRNASNDGIITEETVTLSNELGTKKYHINVWDSAYQLL